MCHLYDLAYLNAGESLTMSLGAAVLLFALELEDDSLLAASVRDDRAFHQSAADSRAGFDGFAVEYRQHFVKFDFRADIARNGLNLQEFARSGAILLPACLNDCVHTDALLWILLKNLRTFSLLQRGGVVQNRVAVESHALESVWKVSS
jgi:hypothetical protein